MSECVCIGRTHDKREGGRYYDQRCNYFWADVRYLTARLAARRPPPPPRACAQETLETFVSRCGRSKKDKEISKVKRRGGKRKKITRAGHGVTSRYELNDDCVFAFARLIRQIFAGLSAVIRNRLIKISCGNIIKIHIIIIAIIYSLFLRQLVDALAVVGKIFEEQTVGSLEHARSRCSNVFGRPASPFRIYLQRVEREGLGLFVDGECRRSDWSARLENKEQIRVLRRSFERLTTSDASPSPLGSCGDPG